MKLWYQSLARQAQTLDYGVDLRKVIERGVEPGTTVHLEGLSEAAGIGAHYRFLEYHDTREVIYNAIKAEKEGYDAFLIGNITDRVAQGVSGRRAAQGGDEDFHRSGGEAARAGRRSDNTRGRRSGCLRDRGADARGLPLVEETRRQLKGRKQ